MKRQGKTMTNSNRRAAIELGPLSTEGAKPCGWGVRQVLLGSTALAGAWGLVPVLAALGIAGTSYAGPPAPTQLPTGGQVVAGSASVGQSGATMTINQSSQRAVIDWQTFNVGAAATVRFNQPSASSVTLNRVLDSNPSQIYGRVTANGQLFFTNPNGVYFGPNSSVDVGGLVATTHSISNTDFMAGKAAFSRDGATGSVVNDGSLEAGLGGYIALLAPEVRNQGVIVAQLGTVALAAGETYELQFDGNNTLANIRVTPATIRALVENKSAVQAPGGLIILSAQAVDRLQGGVVNNSGSLEATGLVNDGGRIILAASDTISHTGTIKADAAPGSAGNGGTVSVIADLANPASRTSVGGTISARGGSRGGNGGAVETSASNLHIADTVRVDTAAPMGLAGTWVLDPTNFAISSGTLAQSASGIGAQTLEAALGAGNVTISTVGSAAHGSDLGDINVNADVLWSANLLTLTASNNININARVTATGTSTLALNPGGSGTVKVGFDNSGRFVGSVNFPGRTGTGILTIFGGSSTRIINSVGAEGSNTGLDLQGMGGSLGSRYVLGADIDASATASWNGGAGFLPIANFRGTIDGFGHVITNLTINRPTTNYVGLIGATGSSGATIRNLGLELVAITGQGYVGSVGGYFQGGSFSNVYATGSVAGTSTYIGGLVGNSMATMIDVHTDVAVSGSAAGISIGGLIGLAFLSNPTGSSRRLLQI